MVTCHAPTHPSPRSRHATQPQVMQVATSWPRAVGQHCRGRRRGVAAAAAGQVTPEAALAYLESQPASGQLVRCALEWATIQALHKRMAVAPTSNVTQHLAGHLGDDLLAIVEQHCVQGTPLHLLSPASLLLPLCPSSVVEHNSLASTAVRLLRSRLSWRRIALRQLNVCVTWGGAVTDVSTANTAGPCLELPLALVCLPCAVLAALMSVASTCSHGTDHARVGAGAAGCRVRAASLRHGRARCRRPVQAGTPGARRPGALGGQRASRRPYHAVSRSDRGPRHQGE